MRMKRWDALWRWEQRLESLAELLERAHEDSTLLTILLTVVISALVWTLWNWFKLLQWGNRMRRLRRIPLSRVKPVPIVRLRRY